MKRIIIISLVLAVMLLFVSWSFAGWNEGGFKNSPLFKHSLNETVANMENQADANSSGNNEMEMGTSRPGCVIPNKPETVHLCETSESTCEGNPTCYLGSCSGPTCTNPTCYGTCYGPTCGEEETCQETCEETCQQTCDQPTCQNCPPAVEGTVYNYYWGFKTDYWGPYSSNRVVMQMAYPYKYVNFDKNNGYYFCDEWGQPAQQLLASGKILNTLLTDQKFKPHQANGSLIQIDFECR